MVSPDRSLIRAIRVVVTDDHPAKLVALTKTLRDAGHCVFSAYDSQSAYDVIAQISSVELLITNNRMGGMNAAELIRCVRALRCGFPVLHIGDRRGIPSDVPSLAELCTPEQLLVAIGQLMARMRGR